MPRIIPLCRALPIVFYSIPPSPTLPIPSATPKVDPPSPPNHTFRFTKPYTDRIRWYYAQGNAQVYSHSNYTLERGLSFATTTHAPEETAEKTMAPMIPRSFVPQGRRPADRPHRTRREWQQTIRAAFTCGPGRQEDQRPHRPPPASCMDQPHRARRMWQNPVHVAGRQPNAAPTTDARPHHPGGIPVRPPCARQEGNNHTGRPD